MGSPPPWGRLARDQVYESKVGAFWQATMAEIENQLSVYNDGVAGLPDRQVSLKLEEEGALRVSANTGPQRHFLCRFDRAGRAILRRSPEMVHFCSS
jgi:hypothetical protein